MLIVPQGEMYAVGKGSHNDKKQRDNINNKSKATAGKSTFYTKYKYVRVQIRRCTGYYYHIVYCAYTNKTTVLII